MCLLVAKPAGIALPEDFENTCEEAESSNGHGVGFATPNNIFKSCSIKPKEFAKIAREHILESEPAIIHWRLSTSGKKNDDNCHPFLLKDGTVFAHNGVIASLYAPTPEMSDTAVLASCAENCLDLYRKCEQISNPGNKFAMITPIAHDLIIIGEKYGTWRKDKMWYSNLYWIGGNKRSFYQFDDDNYYGSRSNCGSHSNYITNNYKTCKESLADLVQKFGISKVIEELDEYCSALQKV